MEGNIIERRQSTAVPPPWLEAKQQPYSNIFVNPPDPSVLRHPSIQGNMTKEDGKTL